LIFSDSLLRARGERDKISFLAKAFNLSTDLHGWLPCGSVFVLGWERIITEGFRAEAFVFAKAPLGGLGAMGRASRSTTSLRKLLFCPQIYTDLHG